MKSFRIFAAAIAVAGLGAGVSAATANAAPAPQPYTCNNQTLDGGTYGPLTVKNGCYIEDATVTVKGDVAVRNNSGLIVESGSTLKVRGNINLQTKSVLYTGDYSTTTVGTNSAPGNVSVGANSLLFADSYGETFHVFGNLTASTNSYVGLGCTYAHECDQDNIEEPGLVKRTAIQAPGEDTVRIGGNVTLTQVLNATVDGVTIGGNFLFSVGGTTAFDQDPNHGYMPIKDSNIGGSLTISGFHGNWFGVIRNVIGGSASITGNWGNSDSTEVVANHVGGNLVCAGNHPPAQFGDAIDGPNYGKNFVGGQAVGECVALTKNPPAQPE